MGVSLDIKKGSHFHSSTSLLSAGKSRTGWKQFLSDYRGRLESLPVPDSPPANYFSSLDFTDKDIWTTLFPVAAVFRKKYNNINIKSSQILNEVRDWALDVIRMHID